jgi:uncharacterized membrane protein YgdD (TMEM256/DUF423 family)
VRRFLIAAAVLGVTGVALGAFGAHGLRATLEVNGRLGTFETASQYHLLHALALIGVALVAHLRPGRWITWSGVLLILGTLVFSGSLYALAIYDLGIMGAVAPVGGVLLLGGWTCLGVAAYQMPA